MASHSTRRSVQSLTTVLTTVTLVTMTGVAAAQAPPGGAPASPMVNAQITAVADAYSRTLLAGDARALAELFTTDGYFLPPNQAAAKGPSAIQRCYEMLLKSPVKMTAFTLSHIEATIHGDVAYSVGTYQQQVVLPDGKSVRDVGKHIAILKRIQGQWKLAYLTYNSDLPSMR